MQRWLDKPVNRQRHMLTSWWCSLLDRKQHNPEVFAKAAPASSTSAEYAPAHPATKAEYLRTNTYSDSDCHRFEHTNFRSS
jgi:hypothetical protein